MHVDILKKEWPFNYFHTISAEPGDEKHMAGKCSLVHKALDFSEIVDINILFKLVTKKFLLTRKPKVEGGAQGRSQFRSNTLIFLFLYSFIHSFRWSVIPKTCRYLTGIHFTTGSANKKRLSFKKIYM